LQLYFLLFKKKDGVGLTNISRVWGGKVTKMLPSAK
jgi:hypothetical protein